MSIVAPLLNLPRPIRRRIIEVSDFVLLGVALWLAFSVRYGAPFVPPNWTFFLVLMLPVPFIGTVILERFGVYRIVTRYIGTNGFRRIFLAVTLIMLVWALIVTLARLPDPFPRSSFILFWLIANTLLIGNRLLVAMVINRNIQFMSTSDSERQNTVIYGAGSAGNQLAKELRFSRNRRVVAFIDDDPSLWGQRVGNIKVRSPAKIENLINNFDVKEVLLALPSASFKRRQEVLKSFEKLPVQVKTIPTVNDITSGRLSVSDIMPISVDDLLGRDKVPPDEQLLKKNIEGKSVLITGAGGSIGSELTRQVMSKRPRTLVLFDLSEAALYEIEMEMREVLKDISAEPPKGRPTKIVAVLGSVLDAKAVRTIISRHEVNTIYHAAAYKHVPLVELNPIAGLNNNTFGTQTVVSAARDLGVERFVLISTDKAVRPTNVMGASKRLAELIVQAHAALPETRTIFSMVRFGNVLASSGSVVKRFNQQIAQGGPVTVTHPRIIRYFMAIPEAAQLVIEAGAMASGGDVFVLDMGEPVKIDDLARMMIRLSGLTVSDSNLEEFEHENSDQNADSDSDAKFGADQAETDNSTGDISGDISIVYTGLRPGEKLFEELLIGGDNSPTDHPQIVKSNERFLPLDDLCLELDKLKQHMDASDIRKIHCTLQKLVEGYRPSKHLPDIEAESISEIEIEQPRMGA